MKCVRAFQTFSWGWVYASGVQGKLRMWLGAEFSFLRNKATKLYLKACSQCPMNSQKKNGWLKKGVDRYSKYVTNGFDMGPMP